MSDVPWSKSDAPVPKAPIGDVGKSRIDFDWVLQDFVRLANASSFPLGITVLVDGFLVSGWLASGKEYFDGVASQFTETAPEETAAHVRDFFSRYGEVYVLDGDDQTDGPPPEYIHLRDARLFNTYGRPIPPGKGMWWRGRLSQVSAFTFGILGIEGE